MASQLDAYQQQLFAHLHTTGSSYKTASTWLEGQGLHISSQGICGWHHRKLKKLKARLDLLESSTKDIEVSKESLIRESPSRFFFPSLGSKNPGKPEKSLGKRIKDEEARIADTGPLGQLGFPIKRKK